MRSPRAGKIFKINLFEMTVVFKWKENFVEFCLLMTQEQLQSNVSF